MVSIIKNQLLKHLSRFTKNLSADKINLSTFKGEGELTNLELDEQVLTELLELPAWIRLTSAWCNRVSFRIPWTKLKSVPMYLTLDEVHITVETCDSIRIGLESGALSGLTGPQGKYSFIHKVIDGMTVIVNTVSVTFKSPAFEASVQISRIRVESKSPDWQHADLRMTRLKHPDQGTLLIFKELEWQTMRIEAKSTIDSGLTPLRLLTNQANCRITIKKRLSDCMILGSRLCLILDELLWVLTDCQLKAALHFVDSLAELVRTTTEATQKTKAARKLELLPEYQAQIAQSTPKPRTSTAASPMVKLFSKFDVLETSYHFLSQGIDLHLCDDPGDGRSCHPHLKEGAALQISLSKFQVDYYPYHLARGNRKHWPKYREASIPPAQWLQQSLSSFTSSLLDLVDPSKAHTPLGRTTNNQNSSPNSLKSDATSGSPLLSDSNINSPPRSPKDNLSREDQSGLKTQVLSQLSKLMTTCVILRVQDFTLYRATTTSKKTSHQEFISDDKDRYSLPEDMPTLHAEFTYYYYPQDDPYPLPPPKFYVHLNPIQIKFDVDTCLWFNSFALNLHQSLLNAAQFNVSQNDAEQNKHDIYLDVKFEAIMTRIIFETAKEYASQKDRPGSLHIQISRACLSNVRERDGSSRTDLATCLDKLQNGGLVFSEDFPCTKSDYNIVANKFLQHVHESDSIRAHPPKLSHLPLAEAKSQLYRELLWTESRDVWCLRLDPVWADFFGAKSVGRARPVPLLDAVPVTLWLYAMPKQPKQLKQTRLLGMEEVRDARRARGNPFLAKPDLSQEKIMTASEFEQSALSDDLGNSVTSNTQPVEAGNADIYALASISNLVSVQINHYQFLFLLRLLEEVAELTTFLAIDSSRILKQDLDGSIVVAAVVPQVEVTFVMPSVTPGKESSGGDMESMIPDSASIAEDLHLAVSGSGTTIWPTTNNSSVCSTLKKSNMADSTVSPLYSPETEPQQNSSVIQDVENINNPSGQHSILTGKSVVDRVTQNVLPVKVASTDISFASIPKDLNAGLSTMKKGFTNFMNKMDRSIDDTISDTMSIRSDVSSDSENFIMVALQNEHDERSTQCIDAMFSLNTFSSADSDPSGGIKASPIEMANEVLVNDEPDTNASTPTEQSQDSCKRKDLISMSTFKLSHVEFVQQSCGFRSNTKVQLYEISCEECSCIPWDELQGKFSSRSRAWLDGCRDPGCRPRVRLRLDHGPCRVINSQNVADVCDPREVLNWFEDFMEVRVKDLDLSLNMSTVTGLTDLVEDEIVPKPLPMQISLDNISLRLVEDRPPANITSPGAIPVNVNIEQMNLSRDASGVFRILKSSGYDFLSRLRSNGDSGDLSHRSNEKALATQKMMTDQLKSDNEELRQKLSAMEGISEQNRSLQKYKEEVSVLKAFLATAQEDVKTLLNEKKTLLDTVRVLQEQLSTLDHGYQNWNSKR